MAWFTEYFQSTVETYCSGKKKKKNPFKLILVTDNVPGHSRDESYTAFVPANTTSILQPMDQGKILAFKSYDLRKSFDGSGQSK